MGVLRLWRNNVDEWKGIQSVREIKRSCEQRGLTCERKGWREVTLTSSSQQNEFEQRGRETRMLQTKDRERQRKRRKCMTMRGKSEITDSVKGWRKRWTNRCVMKGGVYLALHQHGDVHKHVMQLLYAALQTHNVFVTCFNLIQRLFRDPWIHNLKHKRQIFIFIFNKDYESVECFAQFSTQK